MLLVSFSISIPIPCAGTQKWSQARSRYSVSQAATHSPTELCSVWHAARHTEYAANEGASQCLHRTTKEQSLNTLVFRTIGFHTNVFTLFRLLSLPHAWHACEEPQLLFEVLVSLESHGDQRGDVVLVFDVTVVSERSLHTHTLNVNNDKEQWYHAVSGQQIPLCCIIGSVIQTGGPFKCLAPTDDDALVGQLCDIHQELCLSEESRKIKGNLWVMNHL